MFRSADQLRREALQIWRAGVAAVRSDELVLQTVQVEGQWLILGDEQINLGSVGRILVVGAGKAGAGMAAGLERALGQRVLVNKHLTGWINVPADCVRPLDRIHLHPARPAGLNEPTAAGIEGAAKIRELLGSAAPEDLCIALISGGASALLPDPVEGVSLADKLALTRFLSAAGANIEELNAVRRQLSRLKGGGLARACRARRLVALIISDVLGDPLDVIGSGLTTASSTSIADALDVLHRFGAREAEVAPAALSWLEARRNSPPPPVPDCEVHNLIIGNNALAVDGAGMEAERLGYSHAMVSATAPEGSAEEVGRHLAAMAVRMREEPGPDCLISGGEPVVTLAPPEVRGRGGRNQQVVLSALCQLVSDGGINLAIVSGGTDGEDGPTDAAGGICDSEVLSAVANQGLNPLDYLLRSDAYSLLEQTDGLIVTGPTHTNVCDLRVVVVSRNDNPDDPCAGS